MAKKQNENGTSSSVKKRNWAFVLYPESAPKDWRLKLQQAGVMCAVSPLHDKDINPTREPKKPHYHIILVYSGPTTYNAVAKLTQSFNATIPIALEAVKGMYRYFSHKDNPEKYQYNEFEIECLNGFNINDLCELTKSEVNEVKLRVLRIIREMDFIEYADLVDFLTDNEMLTEYDIAINHTFFFNSYIASRRNSYSRLKDKIDHSKKRNGA